MEVPVNNGSENKFEKVILEGNSFLKFIGLKLDGNDVTRGFAGRLRRRWLFMICFFWFSLDVTGQSSWLIGSVLKKTNDLVDMTNLFPCLAFVLMACVKSYYFLKHANDINEIIVSLNTLNRKNLNRRRQHDEFEKKSVYYLTTGNKIMTWGFILAIITFGLWPLITMALIYNSTGEIKLIYPFQFYYPFNAYDIRIWPFLYVHQIWSAVIGICAVWGPDYMCYALMTFIIIQFLFLKQDIITLINRPRVGEFYANNDLNHVLIVEIVNRHNILIRCVELIEAAYSKAILFNVVSSSILICFTGFNITANENPVKVIPYAVFLVLVLGQIYLLCYFGDMIMRSSLEVRDAIYSCRWYIADTTVVKDLIIISLRSSKPCKLTAFGYTDVNLTTFNKILSSAWSYFALLKTVYQNKK